MMDAAPPPAQDARAAVVCVRAEGRRPLEFSGKLVAKRPGYKPPAGTEFTLPLRPNVPQCNNLLRSKVADWSLSVTTSGFTPCKLAGPEFGYRVTYTAKAGARGLSCVPAGRAPIGTWK